MRKQPNSNSKIRGQSIAYLQPSHHKIKINKEKSNIHVVFCEI